jgi:hypothetical protein
VRPSLVYVMRLDIAFAHMSMLTDLCWNHSFLQNVSDAVANMETLLELLLP